MSLPTKLHLSPKPAWQCLSFLADICSSMSQLKQIHAQMILTSRISDHFAASRLLSFSALSDNGNLNYAVKLFNNTHNPNMFMWNTLIRALSVSPNPNQALFFYTHMRVSQVSPNTHTFPFLLKACSSLQSCKMVHTHVFKFGFDLDCHVVNGLIRVYGVFDDLVDARLTFDEFPNRGLSVWTTMITGYAQSFCSNEALRLFDRMIAEGFEPKGATFASVLSVCARSRCLDFGGRIHGFMVERGVDIGVILGTALVHMYAKNGAILMAKRVFDSMPERNIATWNAMLCGLANHGYAEEALELFRKLEKEDIVPNGVTFVGVLSACCHGGLIEIGRCMFNSMEKVYGIEPKIEHFGCMVDLLGRGGKVVEAEELIKGMSWKADVVILGALLSACKNHGCIEIAERAVKEIVALEPDNHMAYVVLSNMYAEKGQWQNVSKLRKKMKAGKLKKTPGWSLVDHDK
ncbi:Pentatricopeptide repeat (PPR) superfamily protein [Euphorbia peplus]|nr:Pentatricopeptide repeat (PPR) superfamily protein [Euphorbia peplus]